ncbi:hypothetical protein [Clostridium ihumii]|uniref:hypothetical protein n=1 Tax=Clostridium ihumii TaxID=1470356 RepID=UPI0005586F26|nr:hypothetical protein [Clostridium ihumii]
MLNIKKFISRKEKNKTNIIETIESTNDEIDLNTLFYVAKYGEEINLKINNHDAHECGEFLALGRTLELEGIRVDISQWADWTITITLFNKGEELKVAESLIPNEYINWNEDSYFVKYYSKLKWVEKGNWCKEIYNKINSLKYEIDSKRKEIERETSMKKAKEKAIEEEKNKKKRSYFENIYNKNK